MKRKKRVKLTFQKSLLSTINKNKINKLTVIKTVEYNVLKVHLYSVGLLHTPFITFTYHRVLKTVIRRTVRMASEKKKECLCHPIR